MKKVIAVFIITIPLVIAVWMYKLRRQVHPEVIASKGVLTKHDTELPELNNKIVQYIHRNGPALAPNYQDVVCTEFVIQVINHFTPLDKSSKRDIRIITEEDLETLIKSDAEVIRGVQTALTRNGRGVEVKKWDDVVPGDFVQFWTTTPFSAWGHCGVVESIVPGESITLYSSHPVTNGYGVHRFEWPEKTYFVRLKLGDSPKPSSLPSQTR